MTMEIFNLNKLTDDDHATTRNLEGITFCRHVRPSEGHAVKTRSILTYFENFLSYGIAFKVKS